MNGCKPDRPGVYRALDAMDKQGVVAHAWSPSQSGPAKRLYKLTPAGRTCLRKWTTTLDTYRQGLDAMVTTLREALEVIETV
jgi:PadR family transcriptional regulator PadR